MFRRFGLEPEIKKDRLGVDMMKQAAKWQQQFRDEIAAGRPEEQVRASYLEKLRWLQHERMIHLMVTMMTVMVFVFSIILAMLKPEALTVWLLTILMAMMTVAYLMHYFKIENLTQRWYLLEKELFLPVPVRAPAETDSTQQNDRQPEA